MKINVIGATGDVDPFNYGGGVVFNHTASWYFDHRGYQYQEEGVDDTLFYWWYWEGLDLRERGDEIEDELEAYYRVVKVIIEDDITEQLDLSLKDWEAVARCTGQEVDELLADAKSEDPMRRVRSLSSVASYDSTWIPSDEEYILGYILCRKFKLDE